MDLYQEFLLTALVSLLLAFLLGKLAGAGEPEKVPAVAADGGLDRVEESSPSLDEAGDEATELRLGGTLAKAMDSVVEIERIGADPAADEIKEVVAEEEEEEEEVREEKGRSLLHGEDEWEGIERSELELLFDFAVKYASSESGAEAVAKLGNGARMRLYGLCKVATEGPCYEPQPMALKVASRAKWNAWQRLGNMNPETAMEQYVTLLSESIPGWTGEKIREDATNSDGNDSLFTVVSATETPVTSSTIHHHPEPAVERLLEDSSSIGIDNAGIGQKFSDQDLG
ncbi:acyl-CoA-binding domain-containing protein 3-like isoform X2 [Ananas comosus]|uniref:Acyl-CoA-binding domain-containing protein 3-like isoform X2 n=1 Tax=Ananas comosus TaxID=4615 RepID=A0A6P5H9N8_ANACO|nr:acyl-CoA-binding domain-containing protein 3-like isoform X2 [Ananas comosus]